jgi:hypothetical protein
MATDPRSQLSTSPPLETESVRTAIDAIYNWNYEPEIDQIRTLYANALERQWIGMRDLDWDAEIDRDGFSRSFSIGGLPITETEFWSRLPKDKRWEVARRSAAFMLSNFLHGEQGALMVAGQLVAAVPHTDGKFYAATQALDEARHVEVFAAYVGKLDEIYPISPALRALLDNVLAAGEWTHKAVGMQVVTEGLALYSFRDMRNTTADPLLKQLLTYVSRDEARHTGYGVKYLSRVVPMLSDRERDAVEDFAFETARLLVDQRAGHTMRDSVLDLWRAAGVDPIEALGELGKQGNLIRQSMEKHGGRAGAIQGFVVPTLRSIGLYSERIAGHFQDMWAANLGEQTAQRMAEVARTLELPDDLEAWVNEGHEAL